MATFYQSYAAFPVRSYGGCECFFYQHSQHQFYITPNSPKQELSVRVLAQHHTRIRQSDPRITKIDQWLSITRQELDRYGDAADYYRIAKPGMTGLWQVSGRSQLSFQTRIALDSWYVRNWSLWYDIAILCKTVRVVLKRQGAC